MTPRVSVVLTTYNRADVLPETIDMILGQTFEDFELIICDDCSPDSTPEICRDYAARDPRVRYLRHEKNLRMPGNLNAGVKEGSGELVANLHDGDVFDPQLLEKWVGALDACPGAAFVFNQYAAVGPDGEIAHVFTEPLSACNAGEKLLAIFYKRPGFGSPVWGTVMARRSAYEEMGFFQVRFGFVSDVDMWLRLAEKYDVAYVAEPLISLPSREALPRLSDQRPREERRAGYQMMWESKRRTTRGHLGRAVFDLGRHCSYVGISESRSAAITLARPVVRRLRGGKNTEAR